MQAPLLWPCSVSRPWLAAMTETAGGSLLNILTSSTLFHYHLSPTNINLETLELVHSDLIEVTGPK